MADGEGILDDLRSRELLQDHTDEADLRALLAAAPVTLYHGIDPSAASLHVGNLVGVLALRRFQDAGHRPIALVGGATGMVGDPGGRSDERNLLDADTLAANMAGISTQVERLLDGAGDHRVEMVDNADWTREVRLLDFLRDVGKHVTVNQMVAKDSIRSRMDGEHGISYTEFSYMLLQAFDFWWLSEHHGCRLQIGGSDQWGNITAGVDLIRRRSQVSAHGLTWPLITKADGTKFGKSADGAVWLDPELTLPYEFHQYFLRADDRDVERFLLQLTLLPVAEIAAVVEQHREAPQQRVAQQSLADAVTTLVHGSEATEAANLAASTLFGQVAVSPEGLEAIRGIVPETELDRERALGDLVDVLVRCGLASSNSDARRNLSDNAYRANGEPIGSRAALDAGDLVGDRFVLLQRGKKNRHLLVVT
ncbi:MAG: tyrosine--tRNA ligase [Acidimicrobiales bacterium]